MRSLSAFATAALSAVFMLQFAASVASAQLTHVCFQAPATTNGTVYYDITVNASNPTSGTTLDRYRTNTYPATFLDHNLYAALTMPSSGVLWGDGVAYAAAMQTRFAWFTMDSTTTAFWDHNNVTGEDTWRFNNTNTTTNVSTISTFTTSSCRTDIGGGTVGPTTTSTIAPTTTTTMIPTTTTLAPTTTTGAPTTTVAATTGAGGSTSAPTTVAAGATTGAGGSTSAPTTTGAGGSTNAAATTTGAGGSTNAVTTIAPPPATTMAPVVQNYTVIGSVVIAGNSFATIAANPAAWFALGQAMMADLAALAGVNASQVTLTSIGVSTNNGTSTLVVNFTVTTTSATQAAQIASVVAHLSGSSSSFPLTSAQYNLASPTPQNLTVSTSTGTTSTQNGSVSASVGVATRMALAIAAVLALAFAL